MSFPTLKPLDIDAFQGIAGEIVERILPHSEADPAGLLAHILVGAGNLIGRNIWFSVGGQRHHANLFAALAGPTSSGRKGVAKSDALFAFRGVDDAWLADRQLQGLSSGEGLIYAVRDPIYGHERDRRTKELVEVMVDSGISDKRLFVVETEFAAVLRRMGRESNTLSMVLRQAWDGEKLQVMTKGSPVCATDAHISVVVHVTQDELRKELQATEAFNGFVNRYLWFCVKRSKFLPDGDNLIENDFLSIRDNLQAAVTHVRGGVVGAIERDHRARELWHSIYPDLNADQPGILGHVTARAAPQVMRLAMIYAVLDQSAVISIVHLRAGLAVWRYCFDSARLLFGGKPTDPEKDKHIQFIQTSANRTVTTRDFHKRFWRDFSTAQQAEAKLAEYVRMGLGSFEWLPPSSQGGRPSKAFILKAVDNVDSGQNPFGFDPGDVLPTSSDNYGDHERAALVGPGM